MNTSFPIAETNIMKFLSVTETVCQKKSNWGQKFKICTLPFPLETEQQIMKSLNLCNRERGTNTTIILLSVLKAPPVGLRVGEQECDVMSAVMQAFFIITEARFCKWIVRGSHITNKYYIASQVGYIRSVHRYDGSWCAHLHVFTLNLMPYVTGYVLTL